MAPSLSPLTGHTFHGKMNWCCVCLLGFSQPSILAVSGAVAGCARLVINFYFGGSFHKSGTINIVVMLSRMP